MKKFEIDAKTDWFKSRRKFYSEILDDPAISWENKSFCQKIKDTVIYESPKTYVDGVAHNDGTWVIYETFRTNKGGKLVGNFKVKSIRDLVKRLYSYMVFLRMAGIEEKKMLVYFTVLFFDRLVYQKGLFNCNEKNTDILYKIADEVLRKTKEELTKDWTRGKTKDKKGCWDDRKRSVDSKGKTKSEVTRIQHKDMNKKQQLDEQIEQYYIEGWSIREMLDVLHNAGVKICKSRYCLWLKEHKEQAVQNDPLVDMGLSKMTRSIETDESAVQNEPSDSENGPSKMVYNPNTIGGSVVGCTTNTIIKKKRIVTDKMIDSFSSSKEESEMIKRHLSYDKEIERRKEETEYDLF